MGLGRIPSYLEPKLFKPAAPQKTRVKKERSKGGQARMFCFTGLFGFCFCFYFVLLLFLFVSWLSFFVVLGIGWFFWFVNCLFCLFSLSGKAKSPYLFHSVCMY